MPLNEAKGRMFKSVGWTWNPIYGCTHNCEYCWAKSFSDRFGRSFIPGFRSKYMLDKFPNDGTWIFVGSMGDMFCRGVKDEWILNVLSKIQIDNPHNKFLLQTKNPFSFIAFGLELEELKEQLILGTTIETNRDTPWSKAPPTKKRYESLTTMKKAGFKTFLSLEPLADFDLLELFSWIVDIDPEAIEIGIENYSNYLPKPPSEKTQELINLIRLNGYLLKIKDSLQGSLQGETK